MSDLSPETRQLLDQAREGEMLPDHRRRAIRRRLAGALGLAAATAASTSTVASGASVVLLSVVRAVGALSLVGAVGAGAVASVRAVTRPTRSIVAPASTLSQPASGWSTRPATAFAGASTAASGGPSPAPPAGPTPMTAAPVAGAKPVGSATVAPRPTLRPPAMAIPAKPSALEQAPPSAPDAPSFAEALPSSRADIADPVPSETAAPRSAMPPREDPLTTEARLIGDAQRAILRGDFPRASRFLEQHERQFPLGTLEPERSSLRVDLLCATGSLREARAAAARFRARHPASPLERRWQQSCPRFEKGDVQ